MKALKRYLITMDGVDCVYRFTVLELCRIGYSLREARQMVKSSGLLSLAQSSWKVTRDLGPNDWVKYVLEHYVDENIDSMSA